MRSKKGSIWRTGLSTALAVTMALGGVPAQALAEATGLSTQDAEVAQEAMLNDDNGSIVDSGDLLDESQEEGWSDWGDGATEAMGEDEFEEDLGPADELETDEADPAGAEDDLELEGTGEDDLTIPVDEDEATTSEDANNVVEALGGGVAMPLINAGSLGLTSGWSSNNMYLNYHEGKFYTFKLTKPKNLVLSITNTGSTKLNVRFIQTDPDTPGE